MFKFIALVFGILALIGFALSNLLTVELLDALAPLTDTTSTKTTNL